MELLEQMIANQVPLLYIAILDVKLSKSFKSGWRHLIEPVHVKINGAIYVLHNQTIVILTVIRTKQKLVWMEKMV